MNCLLDILEKERNAKLRQQYFAETMTAYRNSGDNDLADEYMDKMEKALIDLNQSRHELKEYFQSLMR